MTVLRARAEGLTNFSIFNYAGAGLAFGENGSETRNTIRNGIICSVHGLSQFEGSRGTNDVGETGAGVWCRGVDNSVLGCVIADCDIGFVYWPEGLYDVVYFDGTHVNAMNLPIRANVGNEVYGGRCALAWTDWSVGTAEYVLFPDARESVVKNLTVWNINGKLRYNYKTNRVTFDGLIALGDAAGLAANTNWNTAFYAGDYATYNLRLVNSEIRGFRVGFACGSMGEQWLVNCDFECYQNVVVTPEYWNNDASLLPARTLHIDNVRHKTLPAAPNGNDGGKTSTS